MTIGTTVKLTESGINHTKRFYPISFCKKVRGVVVDQPSVDYDYYEDQIEGFVWVQWEFNNVKVQIDSKHVTPA